MDRDFYIYEILKSQNTVFTPNELSLLWRDDNKANIYRRLSYYCQTGKLIRIKQGLYAKDPNYNRYEFATKQFKPSYVSLITVLREEAMIFQYYETIYLCSYLSRDIEVEKQGYRYKKISKDILLNPRGLEDKEFYFRASKERAFLDALYLYREYYFDNLRPLDWDKCFDLVEIYSSKAMNKRLESYYRIYKEDEE